MGHEERRQTADSLRERALQCLRRAETVSDRRAQDALRALSKDLLAEAEEMDGLAAIIRHLKPREQPQG
jgi:hypothetical protein